MTRKKLLPVHHTGKIRHRRHTSYGWLATLMLLAVIPLVDTSRSVVLASSDPVTLNESVYAVVPGPAPAIAPVVTSIVPGTTFTDTNPVTVAGSCPADTLIKVYTNNVFIGAVFCQNGRFSVPVGLFLGSNTIVVRAFNSNNVMGPESAPLVVQKNLPGLDLSNASQQFFVTSDIYFQGVKVGDTLSWPVSIAGGQAPYAVSVSWGDGKTDLYSRGVAGNFDIKHVYQRPGSGYRGSYDVTLVATDAVGDKAFVHLVSIVGGGATSVVGSVKQGYNLSGAIRLAWQLLLLAVLIVLAFWLGEKREVRLMNRKLRTS